MSSTEIRIDYTGIDSAAGKLRSLQSMLHSLGTTYAAPPASLGQAFEALGEAKAALDEAKDALALAVGATAFALKACGASFEEAEDDIIAALSGQETTRE